MPIYEYDCDDCQEPFELFIRSMSAKVNPVCPKCGGDAARAEKKVTAASALGIGGDGLARGSSSAACAPSG